MNVSIYLYIRVDTKKNNLNSRGRAVTYSDYNNKYNRNYGLDTAN